MSQRTHSPAAKTNKPISKGNLVWKRVNKLAHRLSSKGVPESIVRIVDQIPRLTPQTVRAVNFCPAPSLREMSALAKLQCIEVLQLNMKYQNSLRLERKQTEMTDASSSKHSNSDIKQNLGEMDTHNSVRPQDSEAVFS